ncbi:hypothetical protein [Vibrio algicola]|uniref:hypothetical protein n=1 Tax=Vibrio algicola TaxID=2662262 RepID=UPI003899D25A
MAGETNTSNLDILPYTQGTVSEHDVFKKYGIDENLPKLGLSSLSSGEHLVEHVFRQVKVGDEVRESRVFVVKDTDQKGNIDLRIKYNPSELDEPDDTIDEIEKNTRTEYRLRDYVQSYDPTTVKVTEQPNGQVVVSFNYSKYGLPQDIAYFRFMRVEITVKDNVPLSMTISNTTPFDFEDYQVEAYLQTITFGQLDSGKIILTKKNIVVTGKSRNQSLYMLTTTVPVALYIDDTGVEVINESLLAQVSDPRIRESRVKLDHIFPLMGDMVRRQGIDLPLPYGISVAYRNQDMNIPFSDIVVDGLRLNDLFDPDDSIGIVNAQSLSLRGDINILPFWNVFGYIGKINMDAKVDTDYTGIVGQSIKELIDNKLPGAGLGDKFCDGLAVLCNRGRLSVPLHLEYDLRGVGTTLSLGYREFFTSVTGSVSQTRLKGLTEWGDPIVTIQPMVGYQLVDYRAQVFVGAEYQGLKPRLSGHVKSGDIELDYDIGVEVNQWAYMVGFNKQIGKNYNLTFMYNKGETRNSMTLNFGYRF